MVRSDIVAAINAEREYQERKYGHLDQRNTPHQWAAYITKYATEHLGGDPDAVNMELFKADLIKVAALAVAALEVM